MNEKCIRYTIYLKSGIFERSLSENKKVLNNERTLLSDVSINAIQKVKEAIRVRATGKVYQMPITPALMQARRTANSAYVTRLAEERKRPKSTRGRKRNLPLRRRTVAIFFWFAFTLDLSR